MNDLVETAEEVITMTELNEQRLTEIANALSALSEHQWSEVKRIVEKLYHPTKKALTSEEISTMLKRNHEWFQSFTT